MRKHTQKNFFILALVLFCVLPNHGVDVLSRRYMYVVAKISTMAIIRCGGSMDRKFLIKCIVGAF